MGKVTYHFKGHLVEYIMNYLEKGNTVEMDNPISYVVKVFHDSDTLYIHEARCTYNVDLFRESMAQ
jgi:hypothetical protein